MTDLPKLPGEIRSGRYNRLFAGGWGVSLIRRSKAHFYMPSDAVDCFDPACGTRRHKHFRGPDGHIIAGMAEAGDWPRCAKCEMIVSPRISGGETL